ncbi:MULTISPECIES: heme/hemin ABC transporter substrate-binding protein [Polaromonas]|uniref:Hemin ABC transporter substrate-binding protein n=1 Tax=Polaromonas aquatica TaxID=332657 RepID=A0ABW1U1J6_9BURK
MNGKSMKPTRQTLSRRDALRHLSLPLLGSITSVTGVCALSATAALAQTSRPPRIVSVSGATTEIVYALGAEKQLVGTDTTSLYPAAALQTAKVGYMRALSAEGLLSLKPDAVIGTTEAGPSVVMDQIRTAGVKVELVNADHSWGEVQRKVAAVGRATARTAEAAALQTRLDAQWAEVLASVAKQTGRKPKAIFILAHTASPQVAGDRTAAHAMLAYAGLDNALAGQGNPASFSGYRAMTAEALVVAAPDVIVTTTQGLEASGSIEKFWSRAGLELTPAYKRRSLVALDALYLIGFGPRLPQAVSELHQQALKSVVRSAA